MQQRKPIGRFAPSPTGYLHAGNIFAYLMAWLAAKSRGGTVVLRIEDLDAQRSRSAYADAIQRDLALLGLHWDGSPLYQSVRTEAYRYACAQLQRADALYECFCTRSQASVQSAPHLGEGGGYTGACRCLDEDARHEMRRALEQDGRAPSLRCRVEEGSVTYRDLFQGRCTDTLRPGYDDFIIRRSDGLFAYQLAVVVDDAEQGVNQVVRGIDLLPSTRKQVWLQQALGFAAPTYGHVPLFVNKEGRRLSKRDGAASLAALLDEFKTPEGVIGHIACIAGIIDEDAPASPEDLLACYDERALRARFANRISIEFA